MFQLKLHFSLDNNFLPKEMERLLVSFLKASAQKEGQDFYDSLFDKSRSIIKTYTFSYYLPGASFQKERIELAQPGFIMLFSDADLEELIHFYNAFLKMKFISYPVEKNAMTLTWVSMQEMKEIEDSEVVVKMLSSLLVRQHDAQTNRDRYCLYSDTDFSEVLFKNTAYLLEKLNLPYSMEGFSIQPIKGKKVVVPAFGRLLDGNLGIYKLTGYPELLNFLYLAGAGSRCGEGHGKMEVIL